MIEYRYVTDQQVLNGLAALLAQRGLDLVACDIETTGLSSFKDKLRLLTIATSSEMIFICDVFSLDISCLLSVLQTKTVLMHNGDFDLNFLWRFGFRPGQVRDTMLMSQCVYAGLRDDNNKRLSHSLEAVTKRELQIELPKGLQKSDWSGILTAEQLQYTARDVAILFPLYEKLQRKVNMFGLQTAVDIEHRCLPAVVWMEQTGIPFNTEKWKVLLQHAIEQVKDLEAGLNALLLEELGCPIGIDWASPHQVKYLFNYGLGYPLYSTRESELATCLHPIATLLLKYREAYKLATTYGQSYLDLIEADGRLHPHFLQNFVDTGRFACANPNIQQLPRDKQYRDCITTSNGTRLVCADLSQIEVRIVTKLANEFVMLKAFQNGDDIHTITARQILGKQNITKEDRQIAKSAVFALLYGAGAVRFKQYAKTNYSIDMSLEEATRIRNTFFNLYPGLRDWHRSHGDDPINTRTLTGRWRCNVEKYTEKQNSPSQGSGGDMIKLALALMWERRAEGGGYQPIATIHDEILAEGPAETAEQAKEWVARCMVDASAWMLWPCPTDVEAIVCDSWGAK